MNRTFLNAYAILTVALSITFGSDADAQNCNLPPQAAEKVVWAWGWNYSGQLGDGTTNDRHAPVPVQNLSGIMAVAAEPVPEICAGR